jgi:hypothetical protein
MPNLKNRQLLVYTKIFTGTPYALGHSATLIRQ